MFRFLINLGKGLGFIFDVFSIPFSFAHATFKTFKNYCFCNELHVFTRQNNMYFDDLHDSFFSIPVLALNFDAFWHCYCFHFGTPSASNAMYFGNCFFDDFGDRNFLDL